MRSADYVTVDNIEEKAQLWVNTVRETVPFRSDLILNPPKCALLVIDMLRYFAHQDGRSFLPASAAIISNIKLLINAWRQGGGPVVFTRHCHKGADDLGMLGKFFTDYIKRDELDSLIIDDLLPEQGESVFEKITYDAFIGTNLLPFLKDRQVEQVLITGVLTHMCCETTARSAFCRGFEVYVSADGTASSTESLHLSSLIGMASCVAVVHKTDEILSICDPQK